MICANPKCGKEFISKTHNNVFCKKKCRKDVEVSKRPKPPRKVKCFLCGVLFDRLNRSAFKFCSVRCRNKHEYNRNKNTDRYKIKIAKSAKLQREKLKMERYENFNRACVICGLSIPKENSHKSIICSKKCAKSYRINKDRNDVASITDHYIKRLINRHGFIATDKLIHEKRLLLKLKRKIDEKARKLNPR